MMGRLRCTKRGSWCFVQSDLGAHEIWVGRASIWAFASRSRRPCQASKGYRLHTITTASAKSSGFGGGDRIQATMVFEKLN